MTTKTTLMAFGAMVLVAMAAGVARADHYVTLDRMAHRIEGKAVALQREAIHFRGTPVYGHFLRDAARIRRLAAHVRHEVHRGRNLDAIRGDVRNLHLAVEHIDGLVERLGHHLHPGSRFDYDLHEVHDLIRSIDHCVDGMERVIRRSCAVAPQPVPVPVYRPQPVRVSPYYPVTRHRQWYGPQFGHGGGISISRGGFHLRVGF